MPRKSAAASIPPKPITVGDRRRQLRAVKGGDSPGLKKTAELDLSKASARKALSALYPRPESEAMLTATPDLEAAALAYIEARDAATLATEKKDVAGNVLCNAIAKSLGITGDGWKAVWDMTKGSVDWSAVAKELAIPEDVLAKHRRQETRTLVVRETAEEG